MDLSKLDALGSYTHYVLPCEWRDGRADFDCPLTVAHLVLVLRRLLGDQAAVFYKTNHKYDSSDACMSETTLYVYRKSGALPKLREICTVVHDDAVHAEWDIDDGRWCKESFATIHHVSFDTPLGYTTAAGDYSNLKLLLDMAANAGGYRLAYWDEVWPGEPVVIIEACKWYDSTQSFRLVNVHFTQDSRYHGNFALELM